VQSTIIAGDTLEFDADFPDYPATEGWTLRYRLVPVSGTAITFAATADGSAYTVSVAAATTATWAAKDYAWSAYVTLASARHTVASGVTTIAPDPGVASGVDRRSHARKTLDAIEAVLEGKATKDQSQYQINGRMVTRYSWADLIQMRSTYQAEVRAEEQVDRAAAGLPDRRRLYVRFVRG
jgi:hypothetical protein